MSVASCRLIELPKIADHRGNLTFMETSSHIPFDIKRVYYLYEVPAGAERAAHAHKDLQQVMIALSGSFKVALDDSKEKKEYTLSEPNQGLYLNTMVWRELHSFTENAVCLVLASTFYDEADYFRDYADFIQAARDYYACPAR